MNKFLQKLLKGREVEWKSLGEVAEIYGGLKGKSKKDFENGNAKYISYKNIYDNIEINFDNLSLVKVLPSEKQYDVKYGDVLFTATSETPNEVGFSSAVTIDFNEKVYWDNIYTVFRGH